MERETFYTLLWGWALLGLATFILLLFVTAPYGRHSRKDWGPTLSNRMGWVLMELPSLIVFILCFLLGPNQVQPVTWIFFALYVSHYTNRSVIYPWRTRTSGKEMPLIVALLAVCFNLVNGFINGYYFSAFSRVYTWDWLIDIRFILGMILFAGGVFLNWWSDQILLNLRKGGKKGYYIPKGGLFRWVSCPNFLGEILEWGGFALLTWSPAALVFVLWTFFNLIPRALDHHKWYKTTFPEYPANRKAILPFIL
jgi:protein-S-isoprenylcysteine O-methyltransferase Ste14